MEKLAYEFSTIVTVAPLVAIMKHQVEQLKRFGITETAIYRLYIDWGRGGGGGGRGRHGRGHGKVWKKRDHLLKPRKPK